MSTNNATKPVTWLEHEMNTGIAKYLLLAIITLGIYPIVFCFKLTSRLMTLNKDIGNTSTLLNKLLITNFVTATLYLVMTFASLAVPELAFVSTLCVMVSTVAGIWWAFTARSVMVEYYAKAHGFPMQINGFLLFFFCNIMLLLAFNSAERTLTLHRSTR